MLRQRNFARIRRPSFGAENARRIRDADVIDVKPDTPGLDTMLAKFNIEHGTTRMKSATLLRDADCSTSILQVGQSSRSKWKPVI